MKPTEARQHARAYLKDTGLPVAPAAEAAAIRANAVAVVWTEPDGSGERPATLDEVDAHVLSLLGDRPYLQKWLRAQGIVTGWEGVRRELDRLDGTDGERRPLRIGSVAVGVYLKTERDLRPALRKLLKIGAVSIDDVKAVLAGATVPLAGEELLVVAALLELARKDGRLRDYPPALAIKVRLAGITSEHRLALPTPNVEELCRIAGYPLDSTGRISTGDREQMQRALVSLYTVQRPILVAVRERVGKSEWRDTHEVSLDTPLRLEAAPGAPARLELHPSLALGYYGGALTLDALPVQWAAARQQIGARYATAAMRRGDVYFRHLALGVAAGRAKLPHAGPAGMPKKLDLAGLLEKIGLSAFRAKKGPAATSEAVAGVLDFCQAMGSVVSWKKSGPEHVTVHLPQPEPEP